MHGIIFNIHDNLLLIVFLLNELALRVNTVKLIGVHRVSQLLMSSPIHSWHSEYNRWQVQWLIVGIKVTAGCHWLAHHQPVLWTVHHWLTVNGIASTHELILIIRNLSFAAH